MTATAPIAAAIEEARQVVAIVDVCRCGCGKGECCAAPYGNALRSLLLALDAVGCVPGVICPTCLELAKAEAALRRVEAQETAVDGLRPELYGHAVCIARRYFAEKERSMGNDMYNDEQLAHAKAMSEIRPVTDDEAREILSRFIASHFRKRYHEHARFSIPARMDRDDDPRMSQYITETAALRLALETATRERDENYRQRVANLTRAEMAENALARIEAERGAALAPQKGAPE